MCRLIEQKYCLQPLVFFALNEDSFFGWPANTSRGEERLSAFENGAIGAFRPNLSQVFSLIPIIVCTGWYFY
ncbi:uncharacterized protein YALI1_F09737g [Yarrowia lipolytica]|uniref:Uncharacterized protein n=1 Tax=Yarrowia lipolytica TaxID=4952 RepID=A0A1D8NMB0_YARLL|nr:hypothetical protein YALI1_F09737g [Yarrowia lipolytica]